MGILDKDFGSRDIYIWDKKYTVNRLNFPPEGTLELTHDIQGFERNGVPTTVVLLIDITEKISSYRWALEEDFEFIRDPHVVDVVNRIIHHFETEGKNNTVH